MTDRHAQPTAAARQLSVAGETLDDLFGAVVTRFADLVQRAGTAAPDRMPILLRGPTPERLLEQFVQDLLHLAREQRFAATRLERLVIDRGELRAAVSGWTGAVVPLVGSVTGAELRRDRPLGGWRAVVRFDDGPRQC